MVNLESTQSLNCERAGWTNIAIKISDVRSHLGFLKKIGDNKETFFQGRFINNAIRRYEECWMPMMIKISDNPKHDLRYEPPLGRKTFHGCFTMYSNNNYSIFEKFR